MNINQINPAGLNRKFDDPFLLPSSQTMPETLETAMDFALFLYYLNPNYGQAASRVFRHFITDFDFPGDAAKKEKDDFDEFLQFQLQLLLFLTQTGDDVNCYGNAFARIYFPFDRFLVDPRNNMEYSLDMFGSRARYVSTKMMYEVPDPINPRGQKIQLKFRDRKSMDPSRIKLRLMNPRRILIRHNILSGTSQYVYKFENELLNDIKQGRLHVVNETPMPMLAAIRNNQDFLFDPDTVFHFKAPTVSGISNYGWGLPPTIAHYRNLHQIQVYRKLDEAVGLDYMLPFRLFSPSAEQPPTEMVGQFLNGRWASEIKKIIDNRRQNKFAMHSLPFPVVYQEFGAEGKELTPKDLIEFQTGTLFDGMGYPQELFKGSLQYVQIPTALRMFENSFMYIHIGCNNMVDWVVRRVRQYLNQPKMKTRLQLPQLADSIEKKNMIFQLATMGEISRETGYESLGIKDPQVEMKKRLEEDMALQREQAKAQQELQKEIETGSIQPSDQQSQGGQQGSLPGQSQGQPGAGQTPMNVQQAAQDLAKYWMSLPEGDRRNAMTAAESSDPQTYALAKHFMEKERNAGASQGRQQVNQQYQQGGPQGAGGAGVAGGQGGPQQGGQQ